jgi:hypothetical protein
MSHAPDNAGVPMTGGAYALKPGNPVTKPQYGHDDDADLLPERRRDALGA